MRESLIGTMKIESSTGSRGADLGPPTVRRERPAGREGDQEREAADAAAYCSRCFATHSACVVLATLRPRRAAGEIQMRQRFSIKLMCSLSGSELAGSRPFRPARARPSSDRLQALGAPPFVLAEQHAAEFLEPWRWGLQCCEDRLPFGDSEAQHPRAVQERYIDSPCKRRLNNAGELPETLLVDRDASHQHSLVPFGRSYETRPPRVSRNSQGLRVANHLVFRLDPLRVSVSVSERQGELH